MSEFKRWAIAVGLVLLLSFDGWGCSGFDTDGADLLPGLCRFQAGVTDIHLFDPLNVYPDLDSSAWNPDDGAFPCVQTTSSVDGTGLRMACIDDEPVRHCSLKGVCLDGESQELFRCEGRLVFE